MILPTIYDATLDGIAADAKIGAAIASASERIAIDEAPTVTLNILDPAKELLRSRLWSEPREAPLTLKLGDRSYGLVQVDKQQARELRLIFEQIEVLKLRAQQGYIKAYRSRTTRLAFCARLCREAGVDFHAPESGPNAPEFQPASGAAVRTGGGFDKGAGVTVKGAPASAAQLSAMETVLGVVFGEHAPERAAIAVVMAVTGESVWNPRAGLKEVAPGELSRGSHLGLFQQSSGYTNPLDPVTATKEFLHGSAKPGGPKSAFLDIYRANLSSTTTAHGLATLIHSVQRPNETADQVYTPWYDEAARTVAAFARPGAHRTLLLNDKFEFSRGQPHRPETSWDALGRILSEIGWRRFMVGRTLWATSDEWLMATPARATLTEDTGAVETISWSLDVGKPVDRASVAVDNSWVYAPGVTIRLEDEGPATGKWLLAAWERDLLGVSGTLSLVKPGRTIPEPVGDQSGKGYKPQPTSALPTFNASFRTQPIPAGPYNQSIIGGVHETAGLPGYPALDFGAIAGAPVVACENGTIERFSGHDPILGPTSGVHGPFGWSIYLKGDSGSEYYYTHLGSRTTALGAIVQAGSVIGTVGDYAKWGGANHCHMGVHPGPSGHPDINDIKVAGHAVKKP